MYKLIIADDVVGVHQLLRQIIDKIGLGFEVAECFSNGMETIEYLKHNEADVLITDIKMPLASGIDVAKFVYENGIKTKVIILSAYAEFGYAIEAIKYNVFQYIMKPVDFFELKDTLSRVKGILENESMIKGDNVEIDRECFLYDLLSGKIRETGKIRKKFEALDFKTEFDNTYISVYKIRFVNYNYVLEKIWKYGAEYFNKAIQGVVCGAVQECSECDAFVMFCDNEFMVFAIIGDRFEDDVCAELEKYFSEFIHLGIESIKESRNLGLIDAAQKLDRDIADFFDEYRKIEVEKEALEKKESSSQEQSEYRMEDDIINKVKLYVREHISEEVITRDKIADKIYFTGPYFSKLFKKSTGITFSEFVLNERMKYATELLNSNIKISDIPAKIGYNSYRHFQRIFKNYCGYSPSEYRRKIVGDKMDGISKNEEI